MLGIMPCAKDTVAYKNSDLAVTEFTICWIKPGTLLVSMKILWRMKYYRAYNMDSPITGLGWLGKDFFEEEKLRWIGVK